MTDEPPAGRRADSVRTDPAAVIKGTAVNADTVNGGIHFHSSSPAPARRTVGTPSMYCVTADGEERTAHRVVARLRQVGYVIDDTVITIGGSVVDEIRRLLGEGSSVVICATVRAIGTKWTRQIIDIAANEFENHRRVFVLQLEEDADVEHFATKVDVARFDGDELSAIDHLLRVLAQCLPPPGSSLSKLDSGGGRQHFLDHPTGSSRIDVEALGRFREDMRPEAAARLPSALTPWEFLERAGLLVNGNLTRTGALLFGLSPTIAVPTAMVKCVRYYGTDRSARFDAATYEGTVPDQIESALRFVTERVGRGEKPGVAQARSTVEYDYPMLAVREVIANAIVHRDYTTQDTHVHIRLFSDRLEVSSPGTWTARGLPMGSESELAVFQGQSAKRNFNLARTLSWTWLFEGDARGIPTAVKDCEAQHSPMPVVRQEPLFVTVELRRRPDDDQAPGSAVAEASPRIVPSALPAEPGGFVGRAEELTALSTHLDQDGPAICVVHGMGGTGKTALAVRWAGSVADQFPDGTLYLDLRGYSPERSLEPAEALAAFLITFGTPAHLIPTSVEAQAIMYRSLVATRRILIVLDNVRDSAQVRPLLPGGKQAVVIVTSRNRLTNLTVANGAHSLALGPLTTQESAALLDHLVGADRTAAEPEAVAQLIALCEGLPLALRVVAARATMISDASLDALACELSDEHSLDALQTGDPGTDIRAVLSWSYRTLRPQTAALFRMLGVHPGPDIGLAAIAALAAVPRQVAKVLTNELAQAHLLDMQGGDRFRLHDLLRFYALELTSADWTTKDRDAAIARMLDHYLHVALAAAGWFDPEPRSPVPADPGASAPAVTDRAQALDWFATEHAAMLLLATKAAEYGFDEHAWQLAWAIAPFLEQRGLWHEWLTSQEAALEAAVRTGGPVAQARVHRSLAAAYSQFGRFADASVHLRRVLDLTRAVGDHAGHADALLAMSEICERQNRYHEALTNAQHAWELFRLGGRQHGEARALSALGGGYLRLKQYEQALRYLEHALGMFRELHDRYGEAAVMNQLGTTHHVLGEPDEAIRHHDRALTIWSELDDRYNEAVTRAHIGDAYDTGGNRDAAREFWQRSLTVLRELDDPDAETVRAKLAGLTGTGV